MKKRTYKKIVSLFKDGATLNSIVLLLIRLSDNEDEAARLINHFYFVYYGEEKEPK
jgi:hypothetical protein